jgi:hypothetical protein
MTLSSRPLVFCPRHRRPDVACHAAGEPGGTHVAHSLRTAVHAPQRYADAPGLEVFPGNVLKDLFVQAQLGDQSFELAVLLLQFFQPLRLVHL